MNNVNQKIHASPCTASARVSVQASARVSARLVLSSIAMVVMLGSSLAQAQSQPPRRDDQPQLQSQRFEQPQRSNDSRMREQRDARSYDTRAEEQRRGNDGVESRRTGRMTPDERRDLRRQINEAGQDIYSNPPRR